MKRNDWELQKSASELAEAAQERVAYHMKRVAFWEAERDRAETRISDAGFQLREHPQTGGSRHELVVDQDLTRRLGECESKIQRHRLSVEEYSQWYARMKDAACTRTGTLTLDHADWIFFYGLHGDEDE